MSKLITLYCAVKKEPGLEKLPYRNYIKALSSAKDKAPNFGAMTSLESVVWKLKLEMYPEVQNDSNI